MYNYGLIGNCQVSALISHAGAIEWLCIPQPDSSPVFGCILDRAGGTWSLLPSGPFQCFQSYIHNTNILSTHFSLRDGSQFRILDFCPRFKKDGVNYRPATVIRKIERLKGNPKLTMRFQPVHGWEKTPLTPVSIKEHEAKFVFENEGLTLQSNAPLARLLNHEEVELDQSWIFGFSHGTAMTGEIYAQGDELLKKTREYWEEWVRGCKLPKKLREETIRSALALKLHCFENTGAILAALTTSLPEEIGATRNWDYRFCWIRDSYFVLSALQNLGQTEEIAGYLNYLLKLVASADILEHGLKPLYTVDCTIPLAELIHENWEGYQGSRPVRTRNQASEHIQNDVYGEAILSLCPIFFEERFAEYRTPEAERLIGVLIQCCALHLSEPDAGLWEIRGGWREHTFSNLLCWAGLECGERLQSKGYLRDLSLDIGQEKRKAEKAVMNAVVDGVLQNGPTDHTLDACLLLLPVLNFPNRSLCEKTIHAIQHELQVSNEPASYGFLYRYLRRDDFGTPQSAFLICGFWLVQALAAVGENEHALVVLKNLLPSASSIGLFSEHYEPKSRIRSGNFPQAYSHVGLINSAFAISNLNLSSTELLNEL